MEHLPEEYKPIVQQAVKEYSASGTADKVDSNVLKQFARYAIDVIRSANKPKN
jgi:hypothetical protein